MFSLSRMSVKNRLQEKLKKKQLTPASTSQKSHVLMRSEVNKETGDQIITVSFPNTSQKKTGNNTTDNQKEDSDTPSNSKIKPEKNSSLAGLNQAPNNTKDLYNFDLYVRNLKSDAPKEKKILFASQIIQYAKSESEMQVGLKFLENESELGNHSVSYRLAMFYEDGTLAIKKDISISIRYFNKAIEQGSSYAALHLIGIYSKGDYGLENSDSIVYGICETIFSRVKESDQNYGTICSNLGICLYSAKGCARDLLRAISLFQKAIDKNSSAAQYMLGLILENHSIINGVLTNIKNPEESLKLFEKAASAGDSDAQYKMGMHYKNMSGYESKVKSFQYFSNALRKDHFESKKELIYCYLAGIGVNRSVKSVRLISNTLKKEQDEQIQIQLFICEVLEDIEKRSYVKIDQYIEKLNALKDKNDLARICLFEMYESGFGNIKQDLNMAATFFSKTSADTPFLNRKKGFFCEHGLGGFEKNVTAAFAHYEQAFSDGDVISGYYVALCLIKGKGVEQDLSRAIKILTMIEKKGFLSEANAGYDLCALINEKNASERNVDFDRLHRMVLAGDKEVAHILYKHYLKTNTAKALEYFRLSSEYSEKRPVAMLLSAFESENKNFVENRNRLDSELSDLKRKLSELTGSKKEELDKLKKMNEEFRDELKKLKEDKQSLSDRFAQVKKDLNDRTDELNTEKERTRTLEAQIKKIRLETKKLRTEYESAQQDLTRLSSESNSTQRRSEQQPSENIALKDLVAKLETVKNHQDIVVTNLTKRLEEAEKACNASAATNASQTRNMGDLQRKIKALEEQVIAARKGEATLFEAQKTQYNKETALNSELAVAKLREQKLQSDLDAAKAKASQDLKDLSEKNIKEKKNSTIEITSAEAQIRKMEATIKNMQAKIRLLANQNKHMAQSNAGKANEEAVSIASQSAAGAALLFYQPTQAASGVAQSATGMVPYYVYPSQPQYAYYAVSYPASQPPQP